MSARLSLSRNASSREKVTLKRRFEIHVLSRFPHPLESGTCHIKGQRFLFKSTPIKANYFTALIKSN